MTASGRAATPIPDDFGSVTSRVFELHGRKEFEEGLALAKEVPERFPEHKALGTFWVACFASLAGRPDEAVEALRAGLDRGMWWSPAILTEDPDLNRARELAGFAAIVEESALRSAEANATLQPLPPIVRVPAGPSGPELVALHGASYDVEDFSRRWSAAVEAGAMVIVPWSTQAPHTSDLTAGRSWPDRSQAERDVMAAIEIARGEHDFAPSAEIVGGFSAGGGLAVTMALTAEPLAVRGAIAVGPSDRDAAERAAALAGAAARGTRLWLLVGEHDTFREPTERLHRRLLDAGVASHLEVVPGLGHDFPSDWEALLPEALAFVLDRS